MPLKHFEKTPDEVLDYTRKWSAWLGTDTILTSEWESDDGQVTIDTDTNNTDSATVWLSGGSIGAEDEITNKITTTNGRVAERSFRIKIVEFRAE